MTLRSRAEIEREWACFEGAMRDPLCGPDDLLEAVLGWDPPTDDEFDSHRGGVLLEALAFAHLVELPPMPTWLAELAGITEVARWCLAVLVDLGGIVHEPAEALAVRFGIRAPLEALDFGRALQELRDRRLIAGTDLAVIVRRAA